MAFIDIVLGELVPLQDLLKAAQAVDCRADRLTKKRDVTGERIRVPYVFSRHRYEMLETGYRCRRCDARPVQRLGYAARGEIEERVRRLSEILKQEQEAQKCVAS